VSEALLDFLFFQSTYVLERARAEKVAEFPLAEFHQHD
jgi:hypothetical protein